MKSLYYCSFSVRYAVRLGISLFLVLFLTCIPGFSLPGQAQGNAIEAENARAGNPASEWDIAGAGDLSIQGYATDISYNKGQTARFKIKTDANDYTIKIYRLGYYNGSGARLVGTTTVSATLPQSQPTCITDPGTGLVDCGNWAVSASWAISGDAVSGLYLAKLTRSDNGGASHIAFVVRDDASTSDLLFQTSDATWQAYNVYGDNNNGKSLYTGAGGKASKVSYNRPFYTRSGGGGGGAEEDWLFNAEYPMIRFLEKNGYDMTYTTDVDSDRRGDLIKNHKVFMSVGHDEYWSKGMRDNVAAARNSGTHLAFFSGNEVYWKTRWENSIDDSNTSHRTLVCYKEGNAGENQCNGKCDPSPEWTGLWRSGCEFPGAGGCNPENELSGQMSWVGTTGTIQVPSDYKNLRFWRNTSVAALSNGQSLPLTQNTLGYEWDPEQESYRASYPAGRILLSRTVKDGKTHHLTLYKHSSGALVFAAGTVQWAWGLDSEHDRSDGEAASPAMQQATVNLFADMQVQPATLQAGLVAATATTDALAPTLTVTSPSGGANIASGTAVTITGTAADANTVAGVEVSTDGGTTWRLASGTSNWSFAWTPATQGAATIRSRAFDDSGNISTPTTTAVNVTGPNAAACPCTVFLPADAPSGNIYNDGQSIQLGMKFRSTTSGFITGARFYKQSENTGTHVGQLYSSAGDLLAQATFVNETVSGWQEVAFASPVAITANTTYIISYHSSAGNYSAANPFFDVAKVNGPLRALADDEDGNNGVYKYSTTPTFPTDNFQSSNYYVDVVFNTESGPDNSAPIVTASSPASGAANVNEAANVSITFNEAMDPGTVTNSTFRLLQGSSPIPASVTYDASSLTAILNPTSTLSYTTNYTVEVKGGSADPRVKDAAGNALASTVTWSFTTRNTPPPAPPSPNSGPGGPILVLSTSSNPFSRYAVEILRAEGLNEFAAKDISEVNSSQLNNYDVVILGEMSVSDAQVTMLTDWVNAGGTLIAFRPDNQLSSLLGITSTGNTLSDKYIKVNTTSGPGVGIVDETMQFHGEANLYTLSGATSLAALYSAASTATTNPAVTTRNVGTNGGKAIAFTYDLARSIVYTRQGNPAWAGQKRDGQIQPVRSDDMFFPDWVDFNKIAIPQADEQQRLLANIILQSNMHKKPLPRFWYLPRGLKAAVIMTGDDHGSGGTVGRFNDYIAKSTSNNQQAVDNWTAIRGTSYIYPNTPITDAQIAAFQAQGFEISLHLNTNCSNYTLSSYRELFGDQSSELTARFPSLNPLATHRTHCIAWSDWASQPKVELENGVRLDANYYYWPESWVNDRPGMFTGSGMPMRFADLDGTLIDVYQAATQLTDESGITYSKHINTLLDNALSSKGYYGVFTANMHTDQNGGNSSNGSDAIIASAQQRQIPVISAKQMLTWLNGRNNSSFGAMSWSGNALSFSITAADGSNNLRGMLPVNADGGQLTELTMNGAGVSYTTETIKGILYAFFPANSGSYRAEYGIDNTSPQITTVTAAQSGAGAATITWTTNEASSSRVDYGTAAGQLTQSVASATLATSHSMALSGLAPGTTYYYRVVSTDAANNSVTAPALTAAPLSFTTPAAACFEDVTLANFNAGTVGTGTYATADGLILKPQIAEEFTTLPSTTEWQSFPWGSGGASAIINGQVVVDGARYNTEPVGTTYGPGTSIEFVATFGAAPYQHIGFGAGDNVDMYNNTLIWAMFSTGNAGTGLQARVWDGVTRADFDIPGDLLGAAHHFRIDWKTSSVAFYIDGTLVHTQSTALATPMRVGLSDYNVGGPAVSLDWIRVSPYASTGSFTSRVYDGGSPKAWQEASWTADLPTGTGLQLFQRQGNTATPDVSWTQFTAIPASGANVSGTSRYIQYRADLTSSNPAVTPALQSMSIGCSEPACPTLAFTPATGTALPAATAGSAYTQAITTTPAGYTFTATGLPAGLAIDGASGTISGTPTTSGNADITVTAAQGSCTATATYTLSVNPVPITNSAPVLALIGNQEAIVGQEVSFTATATDGDAGQSKTFSLVDAPNGATIGATSGAFSWTPAVAGNHSFNIRVTDNGSPAMSDEEAITVAVTGAGTPLTLAPVADAHVRSGSYAGTNYGTATSLVVKGTNSSGFARTTYLKFSLSSVSNVSSAKIRIYGSNVESSAKISIAAYGVSNDSWTEGSVTWENAPVALSNILNSVAIANQAQYYELDVTGFVQAQLAGDKVVSFQIKDPTNQNRSLVFNSRENTLNPPQLIIETAGAASNQAPLLASIGDKAVTLGQTLSFTATATDADAGQTKSFSLVGAPAGAAINASTGVFSWKPASVGDYTFIVKVTDDGAPALSDEEQLTVTVSNAGASLTLTPVADAYVRSNSYAGTNYGTATSLVVKGTSSSGLARTTYLKFSLSSVSNVSSAKIRIYGSNVENTTSINIAAYGVSNDSWTETGINWNNAPAASATALSTVGVNNQARYYELDVTAFVQAQLAGDKVVSFQIKDPANLSRSLVFNSRENALNPPQLIIEAAGSTSNQAPVLASIGDKAVTLGQTLSFTATITDADAGQSKVFSLENAPTGAVINASTGVFSWKPASVGDYTFAVKVTDNGSPALSDEEQLTVTVSNEEASPSTVRINSGGPAANSNLGPFSADAYFTGATGTYSTTAAIANTSSDVLYRTYRRSSTVGGSFGYSIPVTNGTYTVKLFFAEIYHTAAGKRKFDVTAEGAAWLSDYDIYAKAGAGNRAVWATKTVTVSDGFLTLNFTSLVDRACVSAIEVLPQTGALSAATTAKMSASDASSGLVDQENEEASLMLYPNPNPGDQVAIEMSGFGKDEKVTLVLYDVRGRAIQTKTAAANEDGLLHTDMLFNSTLSRGVYMIIGTSQTTKASAKLVVW